MDRTRDSLFILSGARGLGKTTICRELDRRLEQNGRIVRGLVSANSRDARGLPLEVWLESIATGERCLLASRDLPLGGPSWPPPHNGSGVDGEVGPALRPFSFSRENFSRGLDILEEAVLDLKTAPLSGSTGTDLIVLDEVGPIELGLGEGFRPFLDRLAAILRAGDDSPPLLLTVRPSLLNDLLGLFPQAMPHIFSVSEENRSKLPEVIARFL